MKLRQVQQVQRLHKICEAVGKLKEQQIKELPHLGHLGLFFRDDDITTGLMNDDTEIKIHLLTGKLLYWRNEKTWSVDLERDDIFGELKKIAEEQKLKLPEMKLENLSREELSAFHEFGVKANKSLELFRMGLKGDFTLTHLWPEHFDFSVEWFTGKEDEQIGTGISPGDEKYPEPYLYMNPWPFNKEVTKNELPIGVWHTSGWNGIKAEWKDFEGMSEEKISETIGSLFETAKKNFGD